ncbi:glycosyltransferase family 31 protein [Mixia osmundae IAM 14324]|nr:glycosyltransferase family 31 protein [Mixia osmundae IAM 14324]KEI37533.1 glycosyltransferase family 31 protein [Mixia osmundae IAM 14324]
MASHQYRPQDYFQSTREVDQGIPPPYRSAPPSPPDLGHSRPPRIDTSAIDGSQIERTPTLANPQQGPFGHPTETIIAMPDSPDRPLRSNFASSDDVSGQATPYPSTSASNSGLSSLRSSVSGPTALMATMGMTPLAGPSNASSSAINLGRPSMENLASATNRKSSKPKSRKRPAPINPLDDNDLMRLVSAEISPRSNLADEESETDDEGQRTSRPDQLSRQSSASLTAMSNSTDAEDSDQEDTLCSENASRHRSAFGLRPEPVSARLLRLVSSSGEDDPDYTSCSQASSRVPSPALPLASLQRQSVAPPGANLLVPSGDRHLHPNGTSYTGRHHHHVHHHYHLPPGPNVLVGDAQPARSNKSRSESTTLAGSSTDEKEDSGSSDMQQNEYNVPDYYTSHHYRTSNLARKLGFSGSSVKEGKHDVGHLPSTMPGKKGRRGQWFERQNRSRRDSNLYYQGVNPGHIHLSSSSSSVDSPTRPVRSRKSGSSHVGFWSRLADHPFVPTRPLTILFALGAIAAFVVSTTTLIKYILNPDKEPLPWRTMCQDQRPFDHALADALPPVNMFVGVFSVDAAYERRHLIRSTYARHSKPLDPKTGQPAQNIQLKFILGRPRKNHARRLALEMETYNDIVVLDIKENMNRGKTYAFMRWAAENATIPFNYVPQHGRTQSLQGGTITQPVSVGFRKADYIVKADDDSFLVLSELERHMRVSPREKSYWGYLINSGFMAGEVYALSADLVQYIASDLTLLSHTIGPEDKKVAKWMRLHPNASSINWISERCYIYDHPKASTVYSHGFLFPDEVERIRLEGRRGISVAETARRGGEFYSQSYSTVNEWGLEYAPPREGMTMEEEVEALIEGGGRWSTQGFVDLPTPNDGVDAESVLFDANDVRLARNSASTRRLLNKMQSSQTAQPAPAEINAAAAHYTKLGHDLLRDPTDVQIPGLSALREGEHDDAARQPHQTWAIFPDGDGVPEDTRRPYPTLRYDAEAMRIRSQRMLGRPYGGTVAVHYLKRNEWFLETSLALLGRFETWDSGAAAPAYTRETQHAVPRIGVADDETSLDLEDHQAQRKVIVTSKPLTKGKEQVDEVPSAWGNARMFGSPIIRPDGYLQEGRPVPPPIKVKEPPSIGFGRFQNLPKAAYAEPNHPLLQKPFPEVKPKEPAASSSDETSSTLPTVALLAPNASSPAVADATLPTTSSLEEPTSSSTPIAEPEPVLVVGEAQQIPAQDEPRPSSTAT